VIKVEPIHLFGCGHPMLFAFAVALGCDLFDSAAYALYAKDDRYLTPFGTKKLSEMNYFPCRCPVCKKYEPQELREMNKSEREEILAKHNLFISFQEIDAVKQAIKENTLFELVESRIRSHPNLLAGWRKIREYGDLVEKYDPKIKRKFLYCGIESIYRPAVKRHIRSLVNVEFEGAEILVSSDFGMYADIYLRPVFGPVLYQMNEVYPAGHAEVPEICEIEEEAIKLAVKNLYALMRKFHDKKFKIYVSKEWAKYMKDIPENGELHVLS
ncbi:MAG TPA: tRNA guanosine(15) transglycosylase TgtA, partial [Archaeoglobus sp.]|nr:tRNA guanosine(15) transglycosylase TgtA [Archaeoglobus sp.]